jgi:radical SAM superfamily enzyme YgiQ (UPF0313 family)
MNKEVNTPFKIVLCEWRLYKWYEKFSLGLFFLESHLKAAGYDVHTCILENIPIGEACNYILKLKPMLVGMPFYEETSGVIFSLSKAIKNREPGIKIVLGGHTATLYSSLIMEQEPAIDFIIYGEGEKKLPALCEYLIKGEDLKNCKGIVFRHKDFVFRNPDRTPIENLDHLVMPFPGVFSRNADIKNSMIYCAMSTTRGCCGHCCYCVKNRVYDKNGVHGWRGMSPQKIVDEIEKLTIHYPGKRILLKFVDSAFEDPNPQKKERLINILDIMEDRKLEIAFTFFTRAESWKEEDIPLIQRMKRLGFYKVSLGFDESINPRHCKKLTESATSPAKRTTVKIFQDNGIIPFGCLILFQPFSSLEDLKNSGGFLEEARMAYHPDAWFHELVLFPDTEVFQQVVECGLLLGVEPAGYSYRYAFEDGRVTMVYAALQKLKHSQAVEKLRNTVTKIDMQLGVFQAWKNRTPEFAIIHQEIECYEKKVKEIYSKLGGKCKELFHQLVDSTGTTGFNNDKEQIMNAFETLFTKKYEKLEREWMLNRMKIGRKGIRII